MADERDARLILRAEDKASRTFDQVAASVAKVRKELQEQAAAADKGVAPVEKIAAALKEYERLGNEIVKQQSLSNALDRVEVSFAKAEARVQDTGQKLADYQAKLGAAGAVTDAQRDKLERLANSVDRAQENYAKVAARLQTAREALEAVGLAAGTADDRLDKTAAVAREIAAGIATATTALEEFRAEAARAGDAGQLAAARDRFDEMAAANPRAVSGQVEALASVGLYTSAIERLQQEERELAAIDVFRKKAQQAQELANAKNYVDFWTQALNEADEAEKRMQQAQGFRAIAADAAAAANDLQRFGATVSAATGDDLSRLANVVRNAVAPTNAAVQTLQSAVEEVGRAAQLAASSTKPSLNEIQVQMGRLGQAQGALVRSAEKIDAFRNQEAAVRRAAAAMDAQAEKVRELAAALATVNEPTEEMARDVDRATRELNRLGTEAQRQRNNLINLERELNKAGIDVRNLAAAETELIGSSQKAGAAAEALSGKLRGKGAFLGLNPYEIQNLGYQVNDVFTQFASGTPIFQILAQQGGQVIQIFEGGFAAIVKWLPVLAPVGIALGVIAAAASRVGDQADRLERYQGIFALMSNGATYSAEQFAKVEQAMVDLGTSADDAKETISTFLSSGLDPANLEAFTDTARNLAKVTGIEVPEAAQKLADAFNGGYEQIVELDNQFHVLTDSERDQIKAMFDSGDASDARTLAFESYRRKAQEVADKNRGEWAESWQIIKRGWRDFIDAVADTTVYNRAVSQLEGIAAKVREAATEMARGATILRRLQQGDTLEDATKAALGISPNSALGPRVRIKLDDPKPAGGVKGDNDANRQTKGGQAYLRTLREQQDATKTLTNAERLLAAERKAGNEAAERGASQAEVAQARLIARTTEQAKITKEATKAAERERKKGESAAKRDARAAEALQNKLNNMEQSLENQLAQMDAAVERGQNHSLETRLGAIDSQYSKIFASIDKYESQGGRRIGDQTLEAFRARVEANKTILKQVEERKFREEQVNDLLKAQKDELKRIADEQERGDISPEEAVLKSSETISRYQPRIQQMAEDAIRFAESLRTAEPNPALEAFIEKMRTIGQEAATGGTAPSALRDVGLAQIKEAQQKIDQLVSTRDATVAAIQRLVELGFTTETDAQDKIAAIYETTQPLIEQQIAAFQRLIDTLLRLGAITPMVAEQMRAALQVTAAEAQNVNPKIQQLEQGIKNILVQGAVEGIDQLAQAFARLVSGVGDVGDFFDAVLSGLANLVVGVVQSVAKLIIQALILKAIDTATGGFISALIKPFAAVLHGGGIVGRGGRERQIDISSFVSAPRYHSGGIAGFAPDEVPAVLRVGEEVLTEDNPRHRNNMGTEAGGKQPITIVNTIDPDEVVSKGLDSSAGSKTLINVLRANRGAVKQVLDI